MPQQPSYETYTIAAAGATKSFNVDNNSIAINQITTTAGGAVTLLADMIFDTSGTPVKGMTFVFFYEGQVATSGFTLSFMGTSLSAAQALYKQIVYCFYDGAAWKVYIMSDETGSTPDINGADIVAGTVPNAALAGGVVLSKLLAAAGRGYMMRAGVNGVWETVNAVTNGTFIVGNGTDVGPIAMSGDATLNAGALTIANDAVTTAKILDANVTPAKLTTELRTFTERVSVSFETGEQAVYAVPVFFSGTVVSVYAKSTKAIAATDDGTITLKNNAGTTMTVTTPIVFTAGDPINTAYSSAVTANNTCVDGDILTVTPAKTTAGGKVDVILEILRS